MCGEERFNSSCNPPKPPLRKQSLVQIVAFSQFYGNGSFEAPPHMWLLQYPLPYRVWSRDSWSCWGIVEVSPRARPAHSGHSSHGESGSHCSCVPEPPPPPFKTLEATRVGVGRSVTHRAALWEPMRSAWHCPGQCLGSLGQWC